MKLLSKITVPLSVLSGATTMALVAGCSMDPMLANLEAKQQWAALAERLQALKEQCKESYETHELARPYTVESGVIQGVERASAHV